MITRGLSGWSVLAELEVLYTGVFTDRETDQRADHMFSGQYLPYYSAIDLMLNQGHALYGAAVQDNEAVALFQFFELHTATSLLSWLAIFMVVVFFVISADSGAMVLNMLSAHGVGNTPAARRIFWTGIITLTTMALPVSGGLESLQTAAIASALPLSFILLWAILGFSKALRLDNVKRDIQKTVISPPVSDGENDWRERLKLMLQHPNKTQALSYENTVVLPILEEFAAELQRIGIEARIADLIQTEGSLQIEIAHGEDFDFVYQVRCRTHPLPEHELSDRPLSKMAVRGVYCRAEVHLREGGQDYDIMGWSSEQVMTNLLSQYENHLHYLYAVR